MQREMDFTDLIDWGREADLAAVTPPPPPPHPYCHDAAGVYVDVLKCSAPHVFIFGDGMRGRIRGCISFSGAECEKLVHSWSGLIAMWLTENNRFRAHNSWDHESNLAHTDGESELR